MRAEEYPDDHPEELLDKARLGGLAPAEQAVLEQHLAGCSACAGQLALTQRFEQELAPQPRDPILYQRAIEGAMERIHSPTLGRRRPLPRWSRWAAAAALLVFGVTGAAAVISRRMSVHPALPLLTEPVPTRAPIPPVALPPAEAPLPAEPPPVKAEAPVRSSAHPVVTAEALFEQGEKLRREGKVDAAIATYRRLQTKFPSTSEARLSFAIAGQVFLKQGRPSDALAQFDRHLSFGGQEGEVGEEALAGKATALEQLHRASEAAAAWKSLLARYPRSVYAERARARLDQLIGHP
jgi:hypothetical protein